VVSRRFARALDGFFNVAQQGAFTGSVGLKLWKGHAERH